MDAEHRTKLLDLLGPERCLLDLADRLPYATDASHFQHRPEAVLLPETAQEVSAIMALANRHACPVTPRGAGSGVTGGAVPAPGGMIMSLDRMHRVLAIEPDNFLAVVQPCVVTAELNAATEPFGLFFAPDPASAGFSTIGGNIAENAGGMRAVKYGVTKHSILGLEVVLPSGEIIRTGSKCLKDVVGYGLTELFVGSEGTLGVITEATCRLLPLPEDKGLTVASFPDMDTAAKAVLAVLRAVQPSALEFMDACCLEALRPQMKQGNMPGIPADAGAQLLIEVDGDAEEVRRKTDMVAALCREHGAAAVEAAQDPARCDVLWRARRSLHNALIAFCPHWREEDVSVPVGRVPDLLRALEDLGRELDLRMACFGHFGDGNIHLNVTGNAGPLAEKDPAIDRVYATVAALEGRIASEHGVGLAKAEYVGWNLDPAVVALMRSMKRLLDPNGILNPGKCFPQEPDPGPAAP